MSVFNQEEANKKKSIIQEEISDLINIHNFLICELATGSGKGKTSMLCIQKSTSAKKWLVLVPEIPLIKNFKEDIIKHSIDIEDKIEDIICYASLKNYEGTELNILMDEGHHSTSDIRLDLLKSINSDQRIVLSATLNYEIKQKLKEICTWYEYKISLEDAINRGILPKPEIKIIYKDLDNIKKDFVYKMGKKTLNLTAKEYYSKMSSNVDYWRDKWESDGIPYQYTKFLSAASNRKRWIATYKTDIAQKIIKEIEDNRFICFCGSVEQAKLLGGKKAIHSKNTKKQNEQIIEDFNSQITDSIFSCNMLREGQNLIDCNQGIIVQLFSEVLYPLQSLGRLLRGDSPVIYILIVKGTQDEKYLAKLNNELKNII